MAHRVMNHDSKCKNLHGHRYSIEVGVDDKVLVKPGESDDGMVIDFSDLKQIMINEIDEKFDHNSIFSSDDPIKGYIISASSYQYKQPIFVPFVPTAENLAKHWYELIEPKLAAQNIKIRHVIVWETPSSTAMYAA